MKLFKKLLVPVFVLLYVSLSAQMNQVTDFGANPGNLDMYLFEPSDPKTDAEVVLVLHGCGQSAINFAEQTGWNVLAEEYGFYVIFAQQKSTNNRTKCFNWFLHSDNTRGRGEAASLVEMVDYVHTNFSTDSTKSFVCGLSAGGSMTPVMMATYPDVFKSGGVWAGVPYLYKSRGNNDISPEAWGDNVRNPYPSYSGTYPTLFICQGTNDNITEPINASRLVDQWTNVHNTDQIADLTNTNFNDNPIVEENIYLNESNDTIIKSYTIKGMSHGIAVDPGEGFAQGGQTSRGSFDVDFHSTYWMARFFGIINDNQTVDTSEPAKSLKIKANILSDGSLKVTSKENTPLQLVLFDVSGRFMLQRIFKDEVVIRSGRLNDRSLIVSILNKHGRVVYSEKIIRR